MNPALRAILLGGAFTPARLFRGGVQGAWFDPSDFSTMFQDSAGTTPVTAVGQPVGKILDKSGNGNHAIQATAANRPVLQQDANGRYYLAFNGTNSAIAMSGSFVWNGQSFFMALAEQGASQWVPAWNSADQTNGYILAAASGSASVTAFAGTATTTDYVNGVQVSPQTRGSLYTLESTKTVVASSYPFTYTGTGGVEFGGYPSFMLKANVYGIIMVAGVTSDQARKINAWLGRKAGLSL